MCPRHINVKEQRFCRERGTNGLKVAEGSKEDTHPTPGPPVAGSGEQQQPLKAVGEGSSENLRTSEGKW